MSQWPSTVIVVDHAAEQAISAARLEWIRPYYNRHGFQRHQAG
jgi:hypothetical protein